MPTTQSRLARRGPAHRARRATVHACRRCASRMCELSVISCAGWVPCRSTPSTCWCARTTCRCSRAAARMHRSLLERAAYAERGRSLFEYWGHEASLLPVELYPLFRWRMDRARRGEGTWGRLKRYATEHQDAGRRRARTDSRARRAGRERARATAAARPAAGGAGARARKFWNGCSGPARSRRRDAATSSASTT